MLEMLMVVAIIGIIMAIVTPQFSKIKENQVLKTASADVFSSINKAYSQTLASLNSSQYGVHFQSDKVIIFKGTSYVVNNANNETISIIAPATISSSLSLIAGGTVVSDLYFSRLSGVPNAIGTITVSTTSYSKIITILATGAFSIN